MVGKEKRMELTKFLGSWKGGDDAAFCELMVLVSDELRILAKAHLRKERSHHTLRTDALVNEVYIRLQSGQLQFNDRIHFFGIASNAMRQVLVDYAREQATEKRGGRCERVHLEDLDQLTLEGDIEILQLNQAIEELALIDEQKATIVVMRYFGGLTIEEVAHVLEASPATIKREWNTAKVRLRRTIHGLPRTALSLINP